MNPADELPVWLITGCSSGLGRALAGRVLARGQRLVATACRPGDPARATDAIIAAAGLSTNFTAGSGAESSR